VALGRGLAWVLYLHALGVCNLALRRLYLRSRPVGDQWRAWAIAFTAINFAVGVGFGWAPVGLTTGRVEAQLVVLLATLCTAAGAIPPFSPYLPAFLFFFLSGTVPFGVATLLSAYPLLHRLGPISMVVFIGGMGGLGLRANRSFAQLVGLRIQAEELAADLQRQKDIAEQANRTKWMFLAAASHDLRQPVHALGLFVGALRGVAMAPDGRRMLAQIEASITAMNSLFSALLDVSRLDAGVVTVERRPFAIQPVMDRVSRDFVREAETKGVSLIWKTCAAVVDSARRSSSASCATSCRTRCATQSGGASSSGAGGEGLGSRCRCATRARASRGISRPWSFRNITSSAIRSATGPRPRPRPCDRPAPRRSARLPADAALETRKGLLL
jgi:two-component system, sensor histidine kinase